LAAGAAAWALGAEVAVGCGALDVAACDVVWLELATLVAAELAAGAALEDDSVAEPATEDVDAAGAPDPPQAASNAAPASPADEAMLDRNRCRRVNAWFIKPSPYAASRAEPSPLIRYTVYSRANR